MLNIDLNRTLLELLLLVRRRLRGSSGSERFGFWLLLGHWRVILQLESLHVTLKIIIVLQHPISRLIRAARLNHVRNPDLFRPRAQLRLVVGGLLLLFLYLLLHSRCLDFLLIINKLHVR